MSRAQLDVGTGRVRTVRMYGKLGAKFGRRHRLAVSSAAEAVRALGAQLPGFDAFLCNSKDNGLVYAVFYGKRNIGEEQLHDPAGDADIRIAPIIIGAKNGGWVRIIVGVILVVAAVAGLFVSWGASAEFSAALASAGWGMIIGGVIQLLTPVPKGRSAQDRPENQPSYSFNGPVNTQAQGNPVPLLYGKLHVGSAVASAGIDTLDQSYSPVGATPGNGSGGGIGVMGAVLRRWSYSELA